MDTTCFALRIPERFPMERSDGARLCGAVGKRAGAASDLIGAESLTETKGECARHAGPRVQEGQCGGDSRYRTGNPTEAFLTE